MTKLLTLGLSLVLTSLALAQPAQDEFVAVPSNLVTDGMPRVPAKLAEELGRWTETRAASLASWHPKRREGRREHGARGHVGPGARGRLVLRQHREAG